MDALRQPFHAFTEDDIYCMGHLSTVAFEPLLRPFRELRCEQRFSFRQTVRTGLKRGFLLPAYDRVKIPTRSSNLVIAMSLNGIDRCSGVALIPLLTKLRELMDFKIFIYTTDLVEAEVRENYFVNDYLLDWNHVYAPRVFRQLAAHLEGWKGGSKPELLIIDSCGGNGSEWITSWSNDHETASIAEYNQLVREWADLRRELAGDYEALRGVATPEQKRRLTLLIKRNASRFIDAPGLRYFLLRWLLNPAMSPRDPYLRREQAGTTSLHEALASLHRSCSHIHWMHPGADDSNLQGYLSWGFIDYVHAVNTVQGFGTALANIVLGRCTNKLTRDAVNYGLWQAKTDDGQLDTDIPTVLTGRERADADAEEESGQEDGDTPEGDESLVLTKNASAGVDLAYPPYSHLPATTHTFKTRRKGGFVGDYSVPFRTIAPYLADEDSSTFTGSVNECMRNLLRNLPLEDVGNPNLSPLSKQRVVDGIFQTLRGHDMAVVCTTSGHIEVQFRSLNEYSRGPSQLNPHAVLRHLPDSKVGQTARLFAATRSHFHDCLRLFSGVYGPCFGEIPLYQLAWKERADYSPEHLAITFSPESDQRSAIFHELGHYGESVCPPIAICCHQFLVDRIEPTNWAHKVAVGIGEHAYYNPAVPWIRNYAGKHYPPIHPQLPKQTEILSMHLECLAHYSSMYRLITVDRSAFYFLCFVLMGGPVKLLAAMTKYKEAKAFRQLSNRSPSSRGYSYRRRRSGTRSSTKKVYGFGL